MVSPIIPRSSPCTSEYLSPLTAVKVVAEAANEWKADLVVVGTHGRRGLGRMLLGSGAEQILRLSPLPVLVIR